ncbi:MAG: exonuclease domain-containing protein [Bacteroidota bacterium]
MPKLYAIVDIETTGGKASRSRITEIAIALHDGKKVIDTYETLINPETVIPFGITQLTGITQGMVEDAPKFYEVAKKIVEMTENAIFVAHNVRFDYGFVREEFKRLGFTYSRRQLCTVRLTRNTFPGLGSYSLDNLIRHFKIPFRNRHRAMGDVEATTILFEKILAKEESEKEMKALINLGVKESRLPKNITLEQLHALPEVAGVYYFYDKFGEVIYVGKSINIKKRVMEHFAKTTTKAGKLQKHVDDISYEITGSELIALLYESYEIKRLRPPINRAQRLRNFPYVIHQYTNDEGFICLDIAKPTAKIRKSLKVIAEYPKIASAKGYLMRALHVFELCAYHCNIESGNKPCFNYHVKKCFGSCANKETPEEYNERVLEAAEYLQTIFEEDFFIVDQGREETEKAVVLVEDGRYAGFGYIETEDIQGEHSLRDVIKPVQGNAETAKIIRRFLAGKHSAKVVPIIVKDEDAF